MLKPAILYKNEIQRKMSECCYSDDMLFYGGWIGFTPPEIPENSDGNVYQYAIVDNDKLIGYFTYQIDWYVSNADCFGLFSFDRNNKIIGIDTYGELRKIINEYKIHRMSWRMIGGNPVEKHYDKFCKKYGGKKFILTDAIKDRSGNYHNDVIYEIVFEK
jgi:hypothetical protein